MNETIPASDLPDTFRIRSSDARHASWTCTVLRRDATRVRVWLPDAILDLAPWQCVTVVR